MLKTVFMGTPELAVPAMRLLAERTDLQLVITQPDRPAGRGKRLRAPAVKQAALELGLPVWQPERLRGEADDSRLLGIDLFVVMAYGEILTQRLLDLPQACINLHASLLPTWRGASPLQAALRAGDAAGGVSVMKMVRALDAGPVYLQEKTPIPDDATLPYWHDRIAVLAACGLRRFLDAWPELQAVSQDVNQVTYCGKLTSADGHLDFQQPATALERQVRAYTPVPGCWAEDEQGQRLRIQRVGIVDASGEPGTVLSRDRDLLVCCAEQALRLERIQPAGKPSMDAAAFLNGHRPPQWLR
jgi:methionyl-tRNA formyltransferase